MKKYNMIEDRNELTQKEVEEGMNFNEILENSNVVKQNRIKIMVMVSSILCIMIAGMLFLYNSNSFLQKPNNNIVTPASPKESLATETYSVFIGNKLAKGELTFTSDEIRKIKSLDLKSSISNTSTKLLQFTFTTLTQNGISQINVNSGLFTSDIITILNSIKPGQTMYFENIVIQEQGGKQNIIEPITASIK